MNYQELYDEELSRAPHGGRSNVSEKAVEKYLLMRGIPIKKASKETGNFRLMRNADGSVVQTRSFSKDLMMKMAKGEVTQFTRDTDFINRKDKDHITHKRQNEEGGVQGLAMKEGLDMLQMWEDFRNQKPIHGYSMSDGGWRMVFIADGKLYKDKKFDSIRRNWNENHRHTEITDAESYRRHEYPNINYVEDDQKKLDF